jgi:cytoskeleton protein RodZ
MGQLTVVPANPAPVAETKPTPAPVLLPQMPPAFPRASPATVVAPATPATAVSGVVPPVRVTEQTIQFRLAQPAWLEVRDSTGKVLHSAVGSAGSAVNVQGLPPFSLVVGNAANVLVSYKNKPVDIKPYIDVTVARFTLK